jgi:serine/threonine protein kinase
MRLKKKSRSGREVSVKQYSRLSDGFEIVVKSFDCFGCDKRDQVDKILIEFFLLTQLKHRCIAPLVGFVFPIDSTPLKTATLYYRSGSLRDVLDQNPVWWTPTAKAKAIAGIALGMKTSHCFRIFHGSLKPNNIMFDEDHCVHIIDFNLNLFPSAWEKADSILFAHRQNPLPDVMFYDQEKERRKRNDPQNADLFSFASIMFNILVSNSLSFDEEENKRLNDGEFPKIPEFVPSFVRELIETGWSRGRSGRNSFVDYINLMKQNNFEFEKGVDIREVLEFVDSVESSSL